MTTNVTDLAAQLVACDSRWSVQMPNFTLFIDDTGFDKIVVYGNVVFMFAGNAGVIQAWKNWLATKPQTIASMPHPNGIAVCLVQMDVPKVLFAWGQDIQHKDGALFAGTGAYHAHTCWCVNRDAMRAVESAKAVDILSGGEVKYVRFKCRTHNAVGSASIHDVHHAIRTRGTVMYHNQKSMPVREAAANDADVRQVVDQIAAGSVVASAPCDSMYQEWTEEDIVRLRAAVEKALHS